MIPPEDREAKVCDPGNDVVPAPMSSQMETGE